MKHTYRDCSDTIPHLVQQISDNDVFPIMCYEPLNVPNQMCELCTFSQIRLHILIKKSAETAFSMANEYDYSKPPHSIPEI